MNALRRVALVFVFGIGVIGCGSSDNVPKENSTVDKASGAYQGGFEVCAKTPLEQHALELDVAPTPDAIADAIGFAIAGQRNGRDYENGKRGCLDAYADAK